MNIDAFDMDWGNITPEGYNDKDNVALQVFNIDLTSSEKKDRACQFILGRINWFNKHLPYNAKQRIVIDVRGQSIILKASRKFKKEIEDSLDKAMRKKVDIEFIM